MTVETGLIIVGGADDQLRLTNKKKRAELVTQTMVDKNIIEQIRTFLLGILLKQSQAAMERGEVKVRDSRGLSELTQIQLSLPYKMSCVRVSLEIPLLSLVKVKK